MEEAMACTLDANNYTKQAMNLVVIRKVDPAP
jgi:hypothetical protein